MEFTSADANLWNAVFALAGLAVATLVIGKIAAWFGREG